MSKLLKDVIGIEHDGSEERYQSVFHHITSLISKECPHGFWEEDCPTCKAEKMLKDRK